MPTLRNFIFHSCRNAFVLWAFLFSLHGHADVCIRDRWDAGNPHLQISTLSIQGGTCGGNFTQVTDAQASAMVIAYSDFLTVSTNDYYSQLFNDVDLETIYTIFGGTVLMYVSAMGIGWVIAIIKRARRT